jgi:FixJ family two-component response regulator
VPAAALTVYIVEDDPAVRDALSLMLGLAGYATRMFSDAESFLVAYEAGWAGCILADLRLPAKSGLELQAELRARGSDMPFIVMTAHGDVPSARTAFQAEAVDFLEKPLDHAQLLAAIETAFTREGTRLERRGDAAKLASLTTREREVLAHVAKGLHAKEIAGLLGVSPRTVEVHKTRIMEKLGVRNIGELVRFAVSAERRK